MSKNIKFEDNNGVKYNIIILDVFAYKGNYYSVGINECNNNEKIILRMKYSNDDINYFLLSDTEKHISDQIFAKYKDRGIYNLRNDISCIDDKKFNSIISDTNNNLVYFYKCQYGKYYVMSNKIKFEYGQFLCSKKTYEYSYADIENITINKSEFLFYKYFTIITKDSKSSNFYIGIDALKQWMWIAEWIKNGSKDNDYALGTGINSDEYMVKEFKLKDKITYDSYDKTVNIDGSFILYFDPKSELKYDENDVIQIFNKIINKFSSKEDVKEKFIKEFESKFNIKIKNVDFYELKVDIFDKFEAIKILIKEYYLYQEISLTFEKIHNLNMSILIDMYGEDYVKSVKIILSHDYILSSLFSIIFDMKNEKIKYFFNNIMKDYCDLTELDNIDEAHKSISSIIKPIRYLDTGNHTNYYKLVKEQLYNMYDIYCEYMVCPKDKIKYIDEIFKGDNNSAKETGIKSFFKNLFKKKCPNCENGELLCYAKDIINSKVVPKREYFRMADGEYKEQIVSATETTYLLKYRCLNCGFKTEETTTEVDSSIR